MSKREVPTKTQVIARWKNMARVLRGLSWHEKRNHFDMKFWGVETKCGTVACAAGHCGMDPWFRKHGLILNPGNKGDQEADGSSLRWLNLTTDEFFGETGSNSILHNTSRRPVGTVIREIESHIKRLEKHFDKEVEFPWMF
jgi:hypothetical protein